MSDTNASNAPESECTHDCSTCSANCSSRTSQPENMLAPANKNSRVKKVIGVVSGKGGVGKSFVTTNLAVLLQNKGYQCAILDADITGPSIPKAMGLKGPARGNDDGIWPIESKKGIRVMSINLLLDEEESPVIWRGPVIAGTVKQFWTDVCWGDVDYMFVDMPPGTGDVPLTVFQSLPVDGIIIVTSPQDLVSMVVAKAVNMAKMMNVPILGIVENYSYFKCPNCGEQHAVFGESHIEEVAARHALSVLAKLPIDPDAAKVVDMGLAEQLEVHELDGAAERIEAAAPVRA
ncbi:MAG: Mrp/NBP35 family ATP-binding protein [Lachnospiraceae bacterium]|nr:Mrp/NBP35 family ATP-binding protein [Lachnospiraceae bacterium]